MGLRKYTYTLLNHESNCLTSYSLIKFTHLRLPHLSCERLWKNEFFLNKTEKTLPKVEVNTVKMQMCQVVSSATLYFKIFTRSPHEKFQVDFVSKYTKQGMFRFLCRNVNTKADCYNVTFKQPVSCKSTDVSQEVRRAELSFGSYSE